VSYGSTHEVQSGISFFISIPRGGSKKVQENLSTTYNPKEVEDKWYKYWEDNKCFHAEVETDKKPFTIVMPPPNVTGALHMGHALDNALQDILTRWKRMQGFNALWVPGTDHAGIATQAKVEEALKQEGLSKYDLGREKFLDKVWDWKHQYGNRITNQLRKLGTSCDWDRERFTMDEGCSKAVQEVFVELYEKGLIYQGNYIVNWCPKCQTTISDIEVEHADKPGNFYHVKYPVKDSQEALIVATTRPETMLGDVAVAVHPEDDRYKHLIGKTVILPIAEREIPVIGDEYVEKEFGTGALKITPGHDPNDFEIGKRHKLPELKVLNKDGTINELGGKYEGLDRYDCRDQIVKDLDAQGYLIQIQDHTHSVGHCYRCATVVEPMISKQWFVRMQPLAEPAIEVVKSGELKFVPERFTKVYLGWLENIRDWCISRQLWWGHRIPVWYCEECQEIICAKEEPKTCPKCSSEKLVQDPDVLDTWFSSGLWPFSTLGWPEETPELKHFYPTSVLVTGRDIIFFWVARMIFTALEFKGEVPFKEVFIHGLVLDPQGRKMSKSLGNGVDPLEVIEEYGADTLRFMLITGNTPGNDLRFHSERLEGSRNFANKIWNAARFMLMNLQDFDPKGVKPNYTLADQWILSRYNKTVKEVTEALEGYELGEAGRLLYDFIWNELCDWYIEMIKLRLYGRETEESKQTAQYVLWYVLENSMKLLHPFMPFITEEIWQHLPHEGNTIMLAKWPEVNDNYNFSEAEKKMELIMETIKGIRNIRGEMNVPPGKKADIVFSANNEEAYQAIAAGIDYIKNLAQGEQITLEMNLAEKPDQAAVAVTRGGEVFIPLSDLIDLDKEMARLDKEIKNLDKELSRITGKLNNRGFLEKAPQEVIAKEKAKQGEFNQKKAAIMEQIKTLQG